MSAAPALDAHQEAEVIARLTRVVIVLFGLPLSALVLTVFSLPESMSIGWRAAVVIFVVGFTLVLTAWSYKDWK